MILGDMRRLTAGLPDNTYLEIKDESTGETYDVTEIKSIAVEDNTNKDYVSFWLQWITQIDVQTENNAIIENMPDIESVISKLNHELKNLPSVEVDISGVPQPYVNKHSLLRVVKDVTNDILQHGSSWIPCEKDLPKRSDSYLVTKTNDDDDEPRYETSHEVFWTSDNKWDCERDEYCEWKVIAWKPKEQPYIPEGE